MGKKKLMLGLAIAAAVFMAIFLLIFFASGGYVGDNPLWVQYLFVISGMAGLALCFTIIVMFLRWVQQRLCLLEK